MKIRFLPFFCLTITVIALNGSAQVSSSLNITRTGSVLRTSWSDPGGVLQQADLLDGSWDVVADALSPYSFPATNHAKFFRLVHGPGGDITGSLSVTVP